MRRNCWKPRLKTTHEDSSSRTLSGISKGDVVPKGEGGVPFGIWALALGLVSTGFAYFGGSLVLKTLNANVCSLIDIIVSPVVATLLGFLILAEIPAASTVYGGALLLFAGFLLTWQTMRDTPNIAMHPCQCQAASA